MNPGRVGCASKPGTQPEWHFVVGVAFVAAVPAATAAVVEAALAALASESVVAVETVVSALPIGGDHAVDTFAVVVPGQPAEGDDPAQGPQEYADGVPVSVVIRGEIAADIYSVGGSRRFTDRDIRPWLLADFQSVTGIVIGSPRFTALPAGEIRGGAVAELGVIPGDTLFWSPLPPEATEKRPGRHAAAEPGDTVLRPRASIEDTVIRPREPLGDTIIRPRREARATSDVPAQPLTAASTESQPEPSPRYGFRVSGGEERRLDSVFYLGRRPVAPRIPSASPPTLVTVDSRTSAVSAVHLEIRQVGDSVVVTDLGSTNGTVVRTPRGKSERLRGGQSVAVMPGTTVDIGDGNIVEILPVNGR
jgi:hypothetical protein